MQKKFWVMVLGFLWLMGIAMGESVKSIWMRWKLLAGQERSAK